MNFPHLHWWPGAPHVRESNMLVHESEDAAKEADEKITSEVAASADASATNSADYQQFLAWKAQQSTMQAASTARDIPPASGSKE